MANNLSGNNFKKEWVLHIDGDAFFASCEVIRRPELWGKAVVVGQERGVVTAMTYPAKKLGIKRGEPIFKIRKEYPDVTILSSHFELYNYYARSLANILYDKVDKFEAYSIDECFVTIFGSEEEVKAKIKNLKILVQKKLGITYSFGVSTNKTLAKVASKKNKPDGACFLMNEVEIKETLNNTLVENIWGIGWQTARRLRIYKIKTALQFSNLDSHKILKRDFTKSIEATQFELQGKTIFLVGKNNSHQKSLQSTRAFIKKINKKQEIISEISRNIEVACKELREKGLYTNRCSIYIKRGDIYTENIVGDFCFPNFTQSTLMILKNIERLFDKFESTLPGIYKGSGVWMYNLKEKNDLPIDLFNEQEASNIEEDKLNNLICSIRNKFGFSAIQFATSIESIKQRKDEAVKRELKDNYISGLPFAYLGEITSG